MHPGHRAQYFTFVCTQCDCVVEAERTQGGDPGRCPSCGAVLQIPEVDPHVGVARQVRARRVQEENATPLHAYAAAGEAAPAIVRRGDGTAGIRCSRCGADTEIDRDFCGRCGAAFTLDGAGRAIPREYDGLALTSFLFGVLAAPLCACTHLGVLVAVAALALAGGSIARRPAVPLRGRGWAIAGAGLGLAGMAVAAARMLNWF